MLENEPSLEMLQSALAYLTTRYSMTTSLQLQHCPACTAMTVADHLQRLLDHPHVQGSDVLNNTYRGLLQHWETLVEHHERNPRQVLASHNPTQLH